MCELVAAITFETAWDFLGGVLREHWLEIAVPLIAAGLGVWLGRRQARRQWRKKEFLNRLNISLNTLHDGKLLIRTLAEEELADVFRNDVAVQRVLAAARKTSAKNPILPVGRDDCWFLLNSVLNAVSEKFADGLLRRDAGLAVATIRYVLCLTSEAAGEARTRKVRAMVVQEDTLEQFAGRYAQAEPELESENHRTRVRTLRTLAQKRKSAPHSFLAMEICVPQT